MRSPLVLAISTLSLLLAACASTVIPDLPDVQRPDVPIAFVDATDVIDARDAPMVCAGDFMICAGRCVDTSNDSLNCGACGRACADGSCIGGMCVSNCLMPRVPCGDLCVDPLSDPQNCGGCGHSCGPDSMCAMGTCVIICPPGFTRCGDRCVDELNDITNCGGCNHLCPTGTATTACVMGVCQLTCNPGITLCGTQCRDVSSDPNNCGACGLVCPAPQTCVASVCRGSTRPPPGAYPIPFAPLATTGTGVVNMDDNVSGLIPLGFTFHYFGVAYTQVNISSNGFLGFDAMMQAGCCTGLRIPMNDFLNNVIAAAWTDLYPPASPIAPNGVTYEMRGTAPNRLFVVSWTSLPWCCSGAPRVSTQIVLHETTDEIEIFTASQDPGHTYTQGAENQTGTVAYFIPGRIAADYSLTNDGVSIYTN